MIRNMKITLNFTLIMLSLISFLICNMSLEINVCSEKMNNLTNYILYKCQNQGFHIQVHKKNRKLIKN